LGGAGNDLIEVFAASADIFGGVGDDVIGANIPGGVGTGELEVDPGQITAHGEEGNDTLSGRADLYGDDGNDTLTFGTLMVGGIGNDTYYVGGFDEQVIDQTGQGAADFDQLVFKANEFSSFLPVISSKVVLNQSGSDLEFYANGFPQLPFKIVVKDWFQDDAHKLDAIVFQDDGATWTPSTVASLLVAQTQLGTAGSDTRVGSTSNPVVLGLAGEDYLVELVDPALLDGGADSDAIFVMDAASFVAGGQGNDRINAANTHSSVVSFNRGDGNDLLFLSGGSTLSLGGGITIQDVQLSGSLEGLTVKLGGTDQIRLRVDLLTNPPDLTLQIVTPSRIDFYDLHSALVDFRSRALQETQGGSIVWPPSGDWQPMRLDRASTTPLGGSSPINTALSGPQAVSRSNLSSQY
jgi:Ca2+-binding RTX toxin-like protein